jgi:hypothetical protein
MVLGGMLIVNLHSQIERECMLKASTHTKSF